jgi:FAD/FMN-containing dehydrogenase
VVKRGDPGYEKARIQYATTSREKDYGYMDPGAIIYPKGDADILKAIAYAQEHKLAIAIRTGGHQYSGASSTSGKNIQIDLSKTYREYEFDKETSIVTTGVSRMLGSLNPKLQKEGVFVPHGQCAHVHVGGHSHTGGYGVPGRAFGLFGDHIIAIRTITADGRIRWINRDTKDPEEADLFYATLGGSPGNFGE